MRAGQRKLCYAGQALRALPRRVCVYVTRMPRAGIYARISSDRDGQQLGVRRQLETAKGSPSARAASSRALHDDDVSAYNGHQPARLPAHAGRPPKRFDRRCGCLAPRPTAPPAQGAEDSSRYATKQGVRNLARSPETSISQTTTAASCAYPRSRVAQRNQTTRAGASSERH